MATPCVSLMNGSLKQHRKSRLYKASAADAPNPNEHVRNEVLTTAGGVCGGGRARDQSGSAVSSPSIYSKLLLMRFDLLVIVVRLINSNQRCECVCVCV